MKLKVTNLNKKFTIHTQGSREIDGFNTVNFKMERGEFLALMGPSGAGKSSLLKCIYRTYLPSSGSILLNTDAGQFDLASLSEGDIIDLRKSEIGYVSQFLKVLPRISATDVVAAPIIELGESEENSVQRAKDIMNFLDLREELFDISPLTFSGGEQQRVNIARAIAAPKQLLLLDEPTASLDSERTEKVVSLLNNLKKDGITMIGIFHDEKIAETVSNIMIRMERVNNEADIAL